MTWHELIWLPPLMLGIALVLNRRFGLTPGDLAAFALVLSTTYRPLRSLAKGWVQLIDAQPSAERIFAVLDAPPETADPPDAVRLARPTHTTLRGVNHAGAQHRAQTREEYPPKDRSHVGSSASARKTKP